MKLRYSRYNFLFENGPHYVLYNTASDGILLLRRGLLNLLQDDDPEPLCKSYPALYDSMLERGMIVDADTDEAEAIIARWREADTNPEHFYLTILPTLGCNLRCWYCYEEHKAQSNMTPEVVTRVIRCVDQITTEGKLKYLHLGFFGGEPLLPFKQTVWPMLQQISQTCKERQIKLLLHFTTNGVLLTPEVISKLISLPLAAKPNVQITLDGNRERHDRSRHTISGAPTYDIIVQNIHAALREGLTVTNRLNYTQASIDSMIDIVDAYEDLTDEEKSRLSFDFQQVWQESNLTEVREKALKMAARYGELNFRIHIDKRYNAARCKSDADNQIAINFDGRLYSCTGRDMTDKECEGHIADDGTLVWNDRHRRRMAIKYGNATCHACRIFPICHGLCSQSKLEADDTTGCLRGLDDAGKLEIVQGRLNFLINHNEGAEPQTTEKDAP